MTAPTPSGSKPVVVHVFGRTDVGRTREHNEDAFVVADLTRQNATLQPEVRTHTVGERGSLFMVADGMGGAAAGEIASQKAIDVVLQELMYGFGEHEAPDKETFAAALKRSTSAANSAIHTFALEHPEYRGMGTTATIATVLGDSLYLAQVGDSRAYLVRDGHAKQITKDQSLMQKLIEAGEITEEEAEQSERRNIILQALGPEANIKVDLTHQQVRIGDVLIICSDGLSGQVKTEEIGRVATEESDLMSVCKRLIDRANENGGPDNITVIAVRFAGEGLSVPETGDAIGHRVFTLPMDSDQVAAAGRPTVPKQANTQPTLAASRPTAKIPSAALPIPAEAMLPSMRDPLSRKTRGTIIAAGLMIVLLLGAFWYMYTIASSTVDTLKATPASQRSRTS